MLDLTMNHFLAKEGYEKKNCAQAILCGFQQPLKFDDELIESFKAYGGGRAPEGVCGAIYGAVHALETSGKGDAINALHLYFEKNAGSIKCKAIKEARQMSCADCVAAAANFLLHQIGTEAEEVHNGTAV